MNEAILPLRMIDVPCPCCNNIEYSEYAHGYDYEYGTSPDRFTFVRCNTCSVLFLNPRPALNELGRIYPQEYEPYHFDKKSLTLTARRWLETRKASLMARNLAAGARILDAGCGGTTFLNCLRRVGSGKLELWGNDISSETCKRISAAGYSVAPGRLEDISLPDAFFDLIILKQVIEHLDKPRAVITKAFRLLKSGGELVVETPNSSSIDARLFGNGFWGGFHFPRHWTIFDFLTLSKMGEEAGFVVKSIDFMLSPAFWVQSFHHLLHSSGFPAWVAGFFSIKNPIPVSVACIFDLLQKITVRTTSNMRIVFSVPVK